MAAKNIVLCSDGTGNSDTKGRGTNVFKLYEAVDIHGYKTENEKVEQVAFYDDGVGTENFAVFRMLGAAFGFGFAKNIRDLYTELVHVYVPGDRLFLFGFSRGAYTIRALAGMIQYCGVLDRRNRERFPDETELKKAVMVCWKEFEKVAFPRFMRDKTRRAGKATEDPNPSVRWKRLGSHDRQIGIDFVGVWDTVGAVGMPVDEIKWILNWICPRKFNELTPGPHVKRACHALSIDDERRTFHPELWNERDAAPGQVDQVWFAGVHSNVGGGYPKQGMSLVALDWMMSNAENMKDGLRFIPAARQYVRAQQDVHDKLYDSRAGYAVYYRWDPRNIARICKEHGIDRPKIHSSVFERIVNTTDGYAPGNIPAALEVVDTPETPRAPQLDKVEERVRSALEKLETASLQELPDVRLWTRVGYLSYWGFFALSIAALYWGLRDPSLAPLSLAQLVAVGRKIPALFSSLGAVWEFVRNVASAWWWLLPALIGCWGLSKWVDREMDKRYSTFWYDLRRS